MRGAQESKQERKVRQLLSSPNWRSINIWDGVEQMGGPVEASRILNVHVDTVRRWIRTGNVPNLFHAMTLSRYGGLQCSLYRKMK